MPCETSVGSADPESDAAWLWATRVTAEAARAALATGRTPRERFEVYERLIGAACEERQRRKTRIRNGSLSSTTTAISPLYDDAGSIDPALISLFTKPDADTLDTAK